MHVKANPRLYVPPEVVDDMVGQLHHPDLQQEASAVLRDADWLVRLPPLRENEVKHGYQPVTRATNTYVRCLTSAWMLTHDDRYRRAAMKHVAGLTAFTHISCEARFNSPPDQEFFYCLSYGELSATIAVLYDVLQPVLTESEQACLFAFLDKHLMRAALKCLDEPPWWANMKWSNWNGVCAGGMGMLALAVFDAYPNASKLIPFVETSLDPYLRSYIENGGGCPEGTGYYNYGMNFAIRYLLSWERATGRKHPALAIKALGKSLHFPVDFTGLTFGDNDGWHPSAWSFLLAERLRMREAALRMASIMAAERHEMAPEPARRSRLGPASTGDLLFAAPTIPDVRELEKWMSDRAADGPVARVYKGMGWAVLADHAVCPTLRMTIRGNVTAEAGHAMQDQMSFKCMVNGEVMITDQSDRPHVSFTKRGNDVFGRAAASKSGLFIDGLGCDLQGETDTTNVVKGDQIVGIRVEGATCYLPQWRQVFIGRLFLLVDNRYWLVIDRAFWPDPASVYGMESRFHTYAESKWGRDCVRLKRGNTRLTLTFAAMGKGVLQQAQGLPTYPQKQTTICRWMSNARAHDHVHVTALNPSAKKLKVAISRERTQFMITITEPDGATRDIRVSTHLKLR